MSALEPCPPLRTRRESPPHTDYEDELTQDQIDTIRRLADPDGKRAAKRVLLYPSLV